MHTFLLQELAHPTLILEEDCIFKLLIQRPKVLVEGLVLDGPQLSGPGHEGVVCEHSLDSPEVIVLLVHEEDVSVVLLPISASGRCP